MSFRIDIIIIIILSSEEIKSDFLTKYQFINTLNIASSVLLLSLLLSVYENLLLILSSNYIL